MAHSRVLALSLALFLLAAASPLRGWWETSLSGHMLGQIPVLIVAGALGARGLFSTPPPWLMAIDRQGVVGLLVTLFALVFWMLPRSLDAALAEPPMEVAKFVSVPVLIGMPLALSWPRSPVLVKGFVLAQLLTMMLVVGWLYTTAPVRLCNYYLSSEQIFAGHLLIGLAVVGGLIWLARALFGSNGTADR